MVLAALLPLLMSLELTAHAAGPDSTQAMAPAGEQNKNGDGNKGKGNSKKNGKKGGKREKEPGRKIAAAEFPNSARTLKKGTLLLSPLLQPSSYAVSNKVQVLVPILPQILGPQVALRYNIKNNKKSDLAIEPFASSDWSFSGATAGANLRYTMALDGGSRLNFGAGAGFSMTLDDVQAAAEDGTDALSTDDIPTSGLTSTNIEIGYDYVVDDKTVWRFVGSTDPYLDSLGATSAVVAANWNHSFNETFRLGLGLGVYVGSPVALAILSEAGIDLEARNIMPLPTVELWWRL